MKKILTILLALGLMLACTACGESSSDSGAKEASNSESTESSHKTKDDNQDDAENVKGAEDEEEAIVDDEDEEITEDEEEDVKDTASEDEEDEKKSDSKATAEAVIIDEDDLTVEITGIDFDDSDLILNVSVKNSSDDTTYFISDDFFSPKINGIELVGGISIEAEPGDSIQESFTVYSGDTEKYGLYDYSEIVINLTAVDTDTLETVYEESVTLYPEGQKKAESFKVDDSYLGDVFIDNEYMRAQILGNEDGITYIYCENKHNEAISFTTDEYYIDGEEADLYISESIDKDSAIIVEDYSESKFSEMEFTLYIETFEDGDELFSDTVKYSAE